MSKLILTLFAGVVTAALAGGAAGATITVYEEGFTGQLGKGAAGPTVDTGGVDWTVDVSGVNRGTSMNFKVMADGLSGEGFAGGDLDGIAVWQSPLISAASGRAVEISFDYKLRGADAGVDADFLRASASIDGGATFVNFFNTIPQSGNFAGTATGTATVGPAGLVLRVAMRNSSAFERIDFDNVLVTAPAATIPEPLAAGVAALLGCVMLRRRRR